MLNVLFIHCSDRRRSSPGKVSAITMTDQMLMEHLIADFVCQEHFIRPVCCLDRLLCRPTETYDEVCDWFEVSCGGDGRVEIISWAKRTPLESFMGGTINLKWIPKLVTDFDIRWQRLMGSIDTAALPHALVEMQLGGNLFHGTIDLRTLPPNLEVFAIPDNHIEAPIDLSALPGGLTSLNLSKNKIFQEEVDVSNLPKATTCVSLMRNNIQKLVDVNGVVNGHPSVRFDVGHRRRM